MINLAIDANEANVTNRVGSNVYAYHILEELAQLIKQKKQITVTVFLSQPPVFDLPKENNYWHYEVITPAKFWTQFALPLYLFKNKTKFDLFFTPSHYAPRFCPIPYISSVMDLAFLSFPEQFKVNDLIQLKNWTSYSVKNAKKVITISEFSKQEITNHYLKKKSDIVVAYPSTSFTQAEPDSKLINNFLKKFKIKDHYFLFVGTLQPRKNLITLIKAYEEFCKLKIHKNSQEIPQLVLAGKIGWLSDSIISQLNKSPVKSQIILTGFVPDILKKPLYEKATATVLIGLYEGFGIPVLESISCKTLAIASNSSSLPEVVGESGLLVNPYKVSSITQALAQAWQMTSAQKQQYQQKMLLQTAKFSWQKSAEKIYQVLLKTAQ